MAIEYDKTGKLFQVDYQSPFGGIDSTAYASAINPQNFAGVNSGYVQDNTLLPIQLEQITSSGSISGAYLGYIPILRVNTGGSASTIIGYVITSTNVYSVTASSFTGDLGLASVATYTPAISGGGTDYFHYIVIDNVQSGQPQIYWTSLGWNEIWTCEGTSATLLTNYCGGGVLALLQNQLLNIGGFSALDGATPNRVSWSAPGEYGQFQPYDIPTATGNYAAGFDDIPSISDVLTGFAAIGTVGYLFRTEGITQVNPTGNGVEPFQFNHLWASELGIGCPYPNSISQYGASVAFMTDAGGYTLGLAGLSAIGGSANSYLCKLLNTAFSANNDAGLPPLGIFLKGRVVPYVLDTPDLMYILQFRYPNGISARVDRYIGLSLSTGAILDFGTYNTSSLDTELSYYFWEAINDITGDSPGSRRINLLAVVDISNAPTFWTLGLTDTQVGVFTFRKEQMKFGYVPTVTKIAVLGALIDATHDGNISFSIDGGLNYGIRTGPSGETLGFPDIVITAGVGNPGQGIIDNIYTDGVVSIQRPQLSIKLTNVQVAEAWYQGTLADFPLI